MGPLIVAWLLMSFMLVDSYPVAREAGSQRRNETAGLFSSSQPHLCMSCLGVDQCPVLGTGTDLYATYSLGCCEDAFDPSKSDAADAFIGVDPRHSSGRCGIKLSFTQEALTAAISGVVAKDMLAGTFDIKCDITRDDRGRCGGPAISDPTYLTAEGRLYWVKNAAVSSNYIPPGLPGCFLGVYPRVAAAYARQFTGSERDNGTAPATPDYTVGSSGAASPPDSDQAAGIASTLVEAMSALKRRDDRTYYRTPALIATGHVTIRAKHAPKHREGKISAVVFPLSALSGSGGTLEPALPGENLFYGDPFSAAMGLWEDAEYY